MRLISYDDDDYGVVPVTIDSDVGGTETVGQHTAGVCGRAHLYSCYCFFSRFVSVEFGAEKIRCYVADAATHHRCYLLEVMWTRGCVFSIS